jgi:hypothetical protein
MSLPLSSSLYSNPRAEATTLPRNVVTFVTLMRTRACALTVGSALKSSMTSDNFLFRFWPWALCAPKHHGRKSKQPFRGKSASGIVHDHQDSTVGRRGRCTPPRATRVAPVTFIVRIGKAFQQLPASLGAFKKSLWASNPRCSSAEIPITSAKSCAPLSIF